MKLHGSLDNYIAMHREKHALSQSDLSKLIGVEQRGLLSSIETGVRRPSLHALLALEMVFGVSILELFRGSAERVQEEMRRQARELLTAMGENQDRTDVRRVELLASLAHPDDVQFVPLWSRE